VSVTFSKHARIRNLLRCSNRVQRASRAKIRIREIRFAAALALRASVSADSFRFSILCASGKTSEIYSARSSSSHFHRRAKLKGTRRVIRSDQVPRYQKVESRRAVDDRSVRRFVGFSGEPTGESPPWKAKILRGKGDKREGRLLRRWDPSNRRLRGRDSLPPAAF